MRTSRNLCFFVGEGYVYSTIAIQKKNKDLGSADASKEKKHDIFVKHNAVPEYVSTQVT